MAPPNQGAAQPGRLRPRDLAVDGAALAVRAGQVAGRHQELADDLAAGEDEGLFEQLRPLGLRQRVMRVEPRGEGAVGVAQGADALRVLDHRADLEPVPHDARVGEQPRLVARAEARNLVDVEAAESAAEGFPLAQHQLPGKPRLVDLEREALEQVRRRGPRPGLRGHPRRLLAERRQPDGIKYLDLRNRVAVTEGQLQRAGRATRLPASADKSLSTCRA